MAVSSSGGKPQVVPTTEEVKTRYLNLLIVLCLITLTMCAYWPLSDNGLVSYDDEKYLTESVYVKSGLTTEGMTWALTTFYLSNWHPLTWLSYMLDTELYGGVNPQGIHMTNLMLHVVNTIVLFYLFMYILRGAVTRPVVVAGVVAVLFAVHPLNVESVAWASERKSVLSTLFWLLTMLAYFRYVEHPSWKRYVMIKVFLILGLMSKPMLVTLPAVLLLADYWPLRRFDGEHFGQRLWRLSLEKAPLFALSLISSAVTIIAQSRAETIVPLSVTSLWFRLLSAVQSYASYVEKTLWPAKLAAFYPYVELSLSWELVVRLALFVGVGVVVVMLRHRRPYLLIGWLWYLVTLLPVIQIVQVSIAPIADRYAYVPTIGIFVMVAALADGVSSWSLSRSVGAVLAGVVVIGSLSVLTHRQVQHWHDSGALFKHALEVTTNNYVAHNNYGTHLLKTGRIDEAIEQFSMGLKIVPDYPLLNFNMWSTLLSQGRYEEAAKYFLKATPFLTKGGNPYFYKMLALSFMRQKNYAEAIKYAQKALVSNPRDVDALQYVALSLVSEGKYEEALVYFSQGIGVDPGNWQLHYNNGLALKRLGRHREASESFAEAERKKK
ncbi:MAG: tetratricopeptide repeat protein [Magnetococcales bacterium]|uniref:Tetratricopeptide repeat protein n=1 Tax=Candidatus Magnetobacterium casense TaxID=1455061 RepID=A0ABS6RXE4_9BACT|nr:tetratricopeptide repeat protein [Nitrospirota bacterium]MBV6341294.1 tetratricopeptide repeat protein [Candidatus Magnetobacterium casensis]